MNDEPKTIKQRVAEANAEHPDWTAKQIADHLGVERYHVYNNAKALGLTLAPAPPSPPPVPPSTIPRPAVAAPQDHAVEVAFPVPANPSSDALDITVFATKPHEMAAAQRALIAWAEERLKEAERDCNDAGNNYGTAVSNGWYDKPFERILNKAAKTVTFYEKIVAALKQGYYIVPPFPLDIFTIRTNRKTPDRKTSTYRWDQRLQDPQLLPIGEGRYVSDEPYQIGRTIPAADAGTKTDITQWSAEGFNDVTFPFAMAKPQIMEATAAAMALKLFDRFGALPQSPRHDPIICGQILKPDRSKTPVTFFIAWWLDTKSL